MIADLGAKYCIVGHSERRANNGDTDELVNTKVHALLEKGITPIVCVGESLSERDRDLTMERISYQVKAALYGLTAEQVKKVVIAYEPIWAIGTAAPRPTSRRRRSASTSARICARSTARSSPARCASSTAAP